MKIKMIEYDQFLGPENAEREYKEFALQLEKQLSISESVELLKTGKWIFNENVLFTIKQYIEKYVPKYVSSFSNSLSNLHEGILHIGVNDNGYVKGIPYKGKLQQSIIERYVKEVINKVVFPSKRINQFVMKNVRVELHSVSYEYKNETTSQYDIYRKNLELQQQAIKKYRFARERWDKINESHNDKLHKSLNRERFAYREYLTDRFVSARRTYSHEYSELYYLCEVPDYYDMIYRLRTKTFDFIPGSKFREYRTKQNIASYELNDVIIQFTYGRYKDYQKVAYKLGYKKIKLEYKPKFKIPIGQNYTNFLLCQPNKMLNKWMSLNRNMKLYLIKITIPTCSMRDDEQIYYIQKGKRKIRETIVSCYRFLDEYNEPKTMRLNV